MQVGKIYVDLEIPDLHLKEFLEVTDCYALEIVETAGTSLPTALMVIKARDEKVIHGINENTSVIIRIGESPENCDSFTVYPQIIEPHRASEDNTWIIEFGGFIGGRTYMINQKTQAVKGNSLEVLKSIYPEENFISGIDKVKDNSITWRQVNETDCQFAINTVLHMDIRPSFPLVGIDKNSNFYIRNFEEECKKPIKKYFVPYEPQKSDCYQYINNFNVKTYKAAYDLFAGFNKNIQILQSESGKNKNVMNPNTPVIAASKVSEKSDAGINQTLNWVQSPNVHGTYTEAYVYNTNKLVSLSSIVGDLLIPSYVTDIVPTDMVYVVDNGQVGQSLTGKYIVDTISTAVNFSSGTVMTRFYVTRDNKNNVENYVKKSKGLKIAIGLVQQLSDAVGSLRVAYATCKNILDGNYLDRLLSFGMGAKNNILRAFSIAGITVDLTSQAGALNSLVLLGNSLMNSLIDSIFPEGIANTLRDFIINKPTLINLIGGLVSQYLPSELQSIIMNLIESLFTTTDTLNSIAKDNGIKVTSSTIVSENEVINWKDSAWDDKVYGSPVITENETVIIDDNGDITIVSNNGEEDMAKQEANDRVSEIIESFEDNTSGLDLPFPIIDLTESQMLYSDEDLKEYVVDQTLENLTELGYLDNEEDYEELKEVLNGDTELTSNLIERINSTAGSDYSYRYWGTFGGTDEAFYAWKYEDELIYSKKETVDSKTRLYNMNKSPYTGKDFRVIYNELKRDYEIVYVENDEIYETQRDSSEDMIYDALLELTSVYIKKSYKDKYRTIPCTKMINAFNNQRVFFACPKREEDLLFYINSKKVDLPYFEVDLGITDFLGNPILYKVFYTQTGYNSSSVMFEVRKRSNI